MKLLTVNNLSAGYNGTDIIKNISFSVDSGQIIGILGANGCGKTTLIKSLANLHPHTGNCQLDTITVESVSQKELARLCGYIPQNNSISLDLTLFDVVMMGFNPELKLLQTPTRQMKETAIQALIDVGLGNRMYDNFQSLSAGQKQLCILARTFAGKRKLLLLDEPESALDFRLRYQAMELLQDYIQQNHASALITLHDSALALNYCDSLLILSDGRLIGTIIPSETSIYFVNDNNEKFFGAGPCQLLHMIEETGSLRSASISMGLAYTKALRMINKAEKELGFSLTKRSTGGRSGGGSTLTPEGKEWLKKYETYRNACNEANSKLYMEIFSD